MKKAVIILLALVVFASAISFTAFKAAADPSLPSPGPVLHWKFDFYPNNNIGVLNYGTAQGTLTLDGAGQRGYYYNSGSSQKLVHDDRFVVPLGNGEAAALFDGSNEIDTDSPSNSAQLDLGTDDMTISFWAKMSANNNYGNIIYKNNPYSQGSYTGNTYWIYSASHDSTCNGPALTLNIDNSNRQRQALQLCASNDNEWHHYTFVISRRGNSKAYADTVMVSSCSTQSNSVPYGCSSSGVFPGESIIPVNTGSLSVGQGFKGMLDELMIYKRALTNSEVSSVYNVQNSLNRNNYGAIAFTPDSNVNTWSLDRPSQAAVVNVQVWGAGGGGGGGHGTNIPGDSGGGGGGGYASKTYLAAGNEIYHFSIGYGHSVTTTGGSTNNCVGNPGAGGGGVNSGSDGGNTAFGVNVPTSCTCDNTVTYLCATGGKGGVYVNGAEGPGGKGGSGYSGSVNSQGHDGASDMTGAGGVSRGGVAGDVNNNALLCSSGLYNNPSLCQTGYQDNNAGIGGNSCSASSGLDNIIYNSPQSCDTLGGPGYSPGNGGAAGRGPYLGGDGGDGRILIIYHYGSSTPSNPTAPTCSAVPATVNVSIPTTLTASGGNASSYSWATSTDGTLSATTGSTITAAYSAAGIKTVTVSSGSLTGNCTVNVVPAGVTPAQCEDSSGNLIPPAKCGPTHLCSTGSTCNSQCQCTKPSINNTKWQDPTTGKVIIAAGIDSQVLRTADTTFPTNTSINVRVYINKQTSFIPSGQVTLYTDNSGHITSPPETISSIVGDNANVWDNITFEAYHNNILGQRDAFALSNSLQIIPGNTVIITITNKCELITNPTDCNTATFSNANNALACGASAGITKKCNWVQNPTPGQSNCQYQEQAWSNNAPIASCSYSYTNDQGCVNDQRKITRVLNSDPALTFNSDPSQCSACQGGDITLPCGRQVALLPFFTNTQIIVVVVLIILIYLIIRTQSSYKNRKVKRR